MIDAHQHDWIKIFDFLTIKQLKVGWVKYNKVPFNIISLKFQCQSPLSNINNNLSSEKPCCSVQKLC